MTIFGSIASAPLTIAKKDMPQDAFTEFDYDFSQIDRSQLKPEATSVYLLPKEYTRLKCERATKLQTDPTTRIHVKLESGDTDAIDIAQREVISGIPIVFAREMPDRSKDVVCLSELKIMPSMLDIPSKSLSRSEKEIELDKTIDEQPWYDAEQV